MRNKIQRSTVTQGMGQSHHMLTRQAHAAHGGSQAHDGSHNALVNHITSSHDMLPTSSFVKQTA
eukprot:1159367-Pelagomonas_calceolata.AAC.8